MILVWCLSYAYSLDVKDNKGSVTDSNRLRKLLKDPKNGQQFFKLLDKQNIINKREAQVPHAISKSRFPTLARSQVSNTQGFGTLAQQQPRSEKSLSNSNMLERTDQRSSQVPHAIIKREFPTLARSPAGNNPMFGTLAQQQPRSQKSLSNSNMLERTDQRSSQVPHAISKRGFPTLAKSQPRTPKILNSTNIKKMTDQMSSGPSGQMP